MSPDRRNHHFFFISRFLVVIILVITAIAALIAHYQFEHARQNHIDSQMIKTQRLIKSHFNKLEELLIATRGAIIAAGEENLTRVRFANYIESLELDQENFGALGLGFIRRVAKADEQRFIEQARQDNAPQFQIKSLSPHDNDRFVIQYIFPEDLNQQAIGLDIGSETNRRTAAILAAKENAPHLTDPITLVQADNKTNSGALILLPVYGENLVAKTPEQRLESTLGWAYAPLVFNGVLAELNSEIPDAIIELKKINSPAPFFASKPINNKLLHNYRLDRNLIIFGQNWQVTLIPNELLLQATNWRLIWIITIGLLLSLLAGFVTNIYITKHIPELAEAPFTPLEGSNLNLNLRQFLRDKAIQKSLNLSLATTAIALIGLSAINLQQQLSSITQALTLETDKSARIINDAKAKYRNHLNYLLNRPALTSLVDAHSTTPTNDLTINNLNQRLGDIFESYMLNSAEIFQIRLITAQSGWREVIKIERKDGQITSSDNAVFQDKSGESYIAGALQQQGVGIYISDMNLNREYGEVEYPMRPMWRFAKAIRFENGDPFAILIINVEIADLLDQIRQTQLPEVGSYITNQYGEFIYHEDPTIAFAFARGLRYRWQDLYQLGSYPWLNELFNLSLFNSRTGHILEKHIDISFDDSTENRFISIHHTLDILPQVVKALWQYSLLAMALALLYLFYITLQFWLWRNTRLTQQELLISEQKIQRDKELEQITTILEALPVAIFILDEKNNIKLINQAALTLAAAEPDQLQDSSIYDLLPRGLETLSGQTNPEPHAQKNAIYKEDPKVCFLYQCRGGLVPVEIKSRYININRERWQIISIENISDRLEQTEQLNQARKKAEKASEAKSAFLANTSHEIRTPLNAIIGLTELLAKDPLNDKQKLFIDKIINSGNALLGIINDVLDLAKIEQGEMTLDPHPFEFIHFIEEIAGIFSAQTESKHLAFHLELSDKLPGHVTADSKRLGQILTNLLSNALKFTDIGSITLKVKPCKKQEGIANPIIQFSIIDTGTGISKDKFAAIFDPFAQADISTSRRYGGTGLGLSIVKKLISAMEGRIYLNSELNIGSEFIVELPLKPASKAEISQLHQDPHMLFIMAAEDDPNDANQLTQLAKKLGWRVQLFDAGDKLVKVVKQRVDNQLTLPDAIIVDWKMPNLDGVETIYKLAEFVDAAAFPAILMISAFEPNEIKQRDPQGLIKVILPKPLDISRLFNAVYEIVSKQNGDLNRLLQGTKIEHIRAQWLPSTQILLVDDNQLNLEVATYLLQQAGAKVVAADSGKRALALLKASSNYDAVLMDIQMPDMDGITVTQSIRRDLGLTKLPIIALTAGVMVSERSDAMSAGMDGFVGKPIVPSELINILRTKIAEYRGAPLQILNQDRGETHPVEIKDNSKPATDWPTITGLNGSKSEGLLMGNQQLLFSALSQLLETNKYLEQILTIDLNQSENTLQREDSANLIHKLRSNAGMVGAEALYKMASETEAALRSNSHLVNSLLATLADELQQIVSNSAEALADWNRNQLAVTESQQYGEENPELSLTERELDRLLTLLEERDLTAIDWLETHSKALLARLGKSAYEQLDKSLQELNFKQALTIIQAIEKGTDED